MKKGKIIVTDLLNQKKIRFIDLFSGMGNMRMGVESFFKKCNIPNSCVLTSEIKGHALTILEHKFPNEHILGDITKLSLDDFPEHDLLLAGFPCQPFSFAGKREGFADTRGTLFFEIEKILKHKKPRYFILENVEGLVTHDKGRTLNTILKHLEELGYNVAWEILDTQEFNLPMRRKRIIIIGDNKQKVQFKKHNFTNSNLSSFLTYGQTVQNTFFTQQLLKYHNKHNAIGKKINDKRGGSNNIHSWDLELKGKINREQKLILAKLLTERRKKHWAKEIGITWMDGMPLTTQQIHTFMSEMSIESLQKNLEILEKLGYVKLEHPKDLVLNSSGVQKRDYRYDLKKGYNIVTGQLSFEFNRVLDPNSISPTILATDAHKLAIYDSLSNGFRKLTIEELSGIFGVAISHEEIALISHQEWLDLLGNTVAPIIIEHATTSLFQN